MLPGAAPGGSTAKRAATCDDCAPDGFEVQRWAVVTRDAASEGDIAAFPAPCPPWPHISRSGPREEPA